jgi:hypothetical protein
MDQNIIGVFEDEQMLIQALRKINAAKISIRNVFTPYPVHEVFKIMSIKTNISYWAFFYSLLGLGLTYAFLYWTSVIDYPLIYGGKPLHSAPSFIIICFVNTISFSVPLTVLTFLIKTRLYPGKRPEITSEKITDDAFIVIIDKKRGFLQKNLKEIHSILKDNGAVEIMENP